MTKKTKEYVCPECGSTKVECEGGDAHICDECYHEWLDPKPYGKFILVDGFAHKVSMIEGDGQYEFVKGALDDVTIAVVSRYINGKEYDLWHDDDFNVKGLTDKAIACANAHEVLKGKVLIANRMGSFTVPLTDKDISRILENLYVIELDDGEKMPAILYEFRKNELDEW